MLKRLLAVTAALLIVFSALGSGPVTVHAQAYTDSIDDVATNFLAALESGQTECTVQTTFDSFEETAVQLFTAYPMLYHYYSSSEYTQYHDHLDITFFLEETEDSMDELWMVGSDEDLMAVLGLCIARGEKQIEFVTKDGYIPETEDFDNAIDQLHYQHTVAYMGYGGRTINWIWHDGHDIRDYKVEIEYRYDLDTATLTHWRQETEAVAQYLFDSLIAQDMPDYLKALTIHDWIINNTRYNTADLEEAGNHLAYGALVKGSAVCMGYAEAGVLLFRAAGIEAFYVPGTGTNSAGITESHGWNAVKIDGDWYLMDMTWDDPTNDDGVDYLNYDYFLVTDDQLAQNHVWDPADAPVSSGGEWSAERALEAREQDPGGYTRYGAAEFMTLAESTDAFRQILSSAAEELEGGKKAQKPAFDPFEVFDSDDSAQEEPQPSVPSSNPQSGREGWMVLLVIVAILSVLLAIVAAVVRINERGRPTGRPARSGRSHEPYRPDRFSRPGDVYGNTGSRGFDGRPDRSGLNDTYGGSRGESYPDSSRSGFPRRGE